MIDPFAEIDHFGNNLNTGLLFATYLGGTGGESARAIAVDGSGSAYVAGATRSQDFPTTSEAFQPELSIGEATKKRGRPTQPVVNPDAFIAKIGGPFLGEGPVDPLSAKPVATADFYSTNEDETLSVAAPGVLENDTDFDSADLTVTGHGVTDNGTVIVNSDGSLTYTPDAGFSGADSFTYTVSDGQASDSALVTIDVAPVNDPPLARNDTYFGAIAEVPFTIAAPGVLRNDDDPEGDALTALLPSPTVNGSLNLMPDGGFTYTANSDFAGTDSFTYKASDGALFSESATVTLNVAAGEMHVGDLVLSVGGTLFRGRRKSESSWSVAVYVNLHDSSENPVVDATVSAKWLGASGTETQVTDCVTEFTFFTASGEQRDGAWCRVYIEGISTDIESITFRVTDISHASLPYLPGANHDFDGDSDGTSITATAPSL